MDWPTDNRPYQPGIHRRAAKNTKHSIGNTLSQDFPRLESGTLNATTLRRSVRRYEWAPIIEGPTKNRLSTLDAPVFLRRASRHLDDYSSARSSLKRAAQQGKFLTKHYPEVDIDQGFLKNIIMSEFSIVKEQDAHDPYTGNLIRPVYFSGFGKCTSGVLYASGETYNQLNSFVLDRNTYHEDIPVLWSSRTPIKQIELSPFDPSGEYTHLCIRNMGGLVFLDANSTPDSPQPKLYDIGELSRDDFGDRSVMDVRFHTSSDAVVVNDQGSLFAARLGESDVSITSIRDFSHDDSLFEFKPFHKVGATSHKDICMVASNTTLQLFDLRDVSAMKLYTTSKHELMASIDYHSFADSVRFMTTSNIVWLDLRNPGKPLFSHKHQLSPAHPLNLFTETIGNVSASFASSTSNGYISVYDVLGSITDKSFCLNGLPYALQAPLGFHQNHDGYAFVKHPHDDRNSIELFQLSQYGSLCFERIGFLPIEKTWSFYSPLVDNSQSGFENTWSVPLKEKSSATIDISPTYDFLANRFDYNQTQAPHELEVALERMVHVLQEEDGPIDHVMTTLEVAIRSSDERDFTSRADFLSSIHVNTAQGHKALLAQQFPFEDLRKSAVWEHDLLEMFQALEGNTPDSPSIQITPRKDALRKEVQFDLTMGRYVYSTRSMSPATADLDMRQILMATETLSLVGDSEPPPAVFGFIRPTNRTQSVTKKVEGYGGEDGDIVPLGARILLKDWEIGQDPDNYSLSEQAAKPSPYRVAPTSSAHDQTRRPMGVPPPIIMTQPVIVEPIQRNLAQSQDPHSRSQDSSLGIAGTQSQGDGFASTQPLPGPFGGRPVGKKKPKRVGGF